MKRAVFSDNAVIDLRRKGMSMLDISKELKTSNRRVRYILKKNNYTILTAHEMALQNKIVFDSRQYEFFDGIVVSDGNITMAGNFRLNLKYGEFINYIREVLSIDSNAYICKTYNKRTRLEYKFYHLEKMNYLFRDEYRRWYKGGKKIIPSDFRFSPISMLSWYLGDGRLRSNNMIEISTEGFDVGNVNNTLVKFLNSIGVSCWVNKIGKTMVSAKSKNKFLQYIGKCPVKCYKYKWDYNNVTKEHLLYRKKFGYIGK